MVVSQKELAQCLGISARQVRNLKTEGLFASTEKQGYVLEKCVQEYINFKVNSERGRVTSISKERIQAEHEEVKKQISLLKLRRLKRELHEATAVEAYLTDMLLQFKNRLLSLPSKMAMQVSGENDVNIIIQKLMGGIKEALEELTEYNPFEVDGQTPTSEEDPEEEWEEEED